LQIPAHRFNRTTQALAMTASSLDAHQAKKMTQAATRRIKLYSPPQKHQIIRGNPGDSLRQDKEVHTENIK
jgi:hypothetical protein